MRAMVAYAMTLLLHLVTGSDLTSDPQLRGAFWELLADARYGFDALEEAAFVVRDEAGRHRLVRWPRADTSHHAAWKGAIPRGTIAIVHTHPNDSPHPSPVDMSTARLRGVPVYVLTRSRITRTLGEGSEVLVRGNWRPRPDQWAAAG